jgi:DNA-binding transcriptional MerR regulator
MSYTVKQLAKLSGVSPRTLRFYDELGLLKPAYYGDNHYRYYEEEQLLMLQQILFFREMNLPLADIQRIIASHDFDKIETLIRHKSILQSNLERTKILIETIDKTISHLRGKFIMKDSELYAGFDPEKQKEYQNYLVEHHIVTEQELHKYHKKVKDWKKEDWKNHKQESDALIHAFLEAFTQNLQPEDPAVQAIVGRHHDWIKSFWTPSQKSYIELGQLYKEHPDFRKFYDAYDARLVDYIFTAMEIFAIDRLD